MKRTAGPRPAPEQSAAQRPVPPHAERWLVPLPAGVRPPLEVFVNGVAQAEGADYELERHGGRLALAFSRPLEKEGRLGFWRWALMFLSIAGTYRRNDSVDVQYSAGGERRVATALEIIPPSKGPGRAQPGP